MRHVFKHISFDINNKRILELDQNKHDGAVTVKTFDENGEQENESYSISNGDFVMLLNFYRYIKEHDVRNDFINPNGASTEMA